MSWVKSSVALLLPGRERFNDGNIGDTAGVVIVTYSHFTAIMRLVKPSPRPCLAFLTSVPLSQLPHAGDTVCLLDIIVIFKAVAEPPRDRLDERILFD